MGNEGLCSLGADYPRRPGHRRVNDPALAWEHISRSHQPGTEVALLYWRAIAVFSGLILMLNSLQQTESTSTGRSGDGHKRARLVQGGGQTHVRHAR